MERRLELLFGIIGGLVLVVLEHPLVGLHMVLGGFHGFITNFITQIISIFGLIITIYFSFLLIIDALKYIHKK